VIAGGGGDGAPLFSRPQPQSEGHTPGGVRLLTSKHTDKAGTKHRHNPGPARRTPVPTTTTAVPESNMHHNDSTGTGRNGKGPGSASAGIGTHGGAHAGGIALSGAGAAGGGRPGGGEVKGVPIGASFSTNTQDALEPGAPGLHGAGAGTSQTPWPAIGIAAAAVLLALLGSLLERRRPQVVL
jgi:hypothetical protein